MTSCCIHFLVNIGERKSILWASIIEVRIIDAHAPRAILLRDEYDIGQPLGIPNLFDESSGEEFVHFLFYDFLVCWVKSPQFLTFRLAFISKVQVIVDLTRSTGRHDSL